MDFVSEFDSPSRGDWILNPLDLACPTNSEPVNQREKLDNRYVGPHAIESHASQRILRGFSRVSLIDIGQLHLVSGDLLYLLCKLLDLCAILLAGRSYMQRQQVSQRVHPACTFTPLYILWKWW